MVSIPGEKIADAGYSADTTAYYTVSVDEERGRIIINLEDSALEKPGKQD